MYRSGNVNRRTYGGTCALVALGAIASLFAGAPLTALSQVPGVVFSQANGIGGIDGYGGTVSHIAANSRGDVLIGSVNGSLASIEEYPAGSATPVTLVSHMFNNGYGNGNVGVAVDSSGNVYAADPGDGSIVFIPFVNGTYPSGVAYTTLSNCGNGNFPFATQGLTTACKGFQYLPSAFGYYLQFIDVGVDGSGNLYVLSQYTGGSGSTYANGQNMIVEWSASNGSYTLLADNLPNQGGAEIAVDAAGDVYYVDATSRSTIQYMAAGLTSVTAGTTTNNSLPSTFGSGFTQPTGVSIDAGGNVYVTDKVAISGSSSNRIVEFPNINGTVSGTDQYTLSNEFSTGYSNLGNTSNNEYGPSTGVGIDGYGNVYYAGAYPNSLNSAAFGRVALGTTATGSTSGAQTLNVSFTAAVTFGSFSISGPFSVSATTCTASTPYALNSVCTVSVTYTPTAPGPQSGILTAYDNSNDVLATAYLSGVGQASALDVDPGTVAAIGATWTSPSAIAVDVAGNTYVVDSVTGKVYKTAAGATTSTAVASGFSSPSAVAVDGGGNLYVGDSGNDRVVEVPYANGAYGNPVVLGTGLSGASGLAIDDVGNLYVADSGNARVLLLSSSGNRKTGSLVTNVGSGFSKPVAVAVDNAGHLYISDAGTNDVVQWDLTSSQKSTVLSGLSAAAGVAVDAGGSLYAADSGAGTITRVPNISGTLDTSLKTTLAIVVAKPDAIAVDEMGNLYAADSADAAVAEMNRTMGLLKFGSLNVMSSSTTVSAEVSDGGNSALVFNTPNYTITGAGTASYAIQGASTCASGGTVNPGAVCTVAAIFTPQSSGVKTETLTFSSNAANNQGTLELTGSGAALTVTSVGLGVTSPTGTPVVGQAVTVTATVTPASGPTGTVTFYVDTVAQTPSVSLSGGMAAITLTGLAGGPHTIAAIYSGDAAYASSNSSLSLTIATAPTVTSNVMLSASSALAGTSIAMSATIAPTPSGTPTGTVTFYNGAAVLGSGPVTAAQVNGAAGGQASFTTSTLATGSYNITASYSGDSNFSASVSAAPVAMQIVALPPVLAHVVFSQANGVSGIDNYGGTVSHIAANSRGDVFVGVNAGGTAMIQEFPAGTTTPVTLVSGMGQNGSIGVTVDASGNVYAADPGDEKIIFIPFVNGTYPSGATFSSLTYCGSSGNFPFASPTQTSACTGFQYLPSAYGYYLQFIDVGLDGAGNLYTLSKYTGGSGATYANGQNMILEWSASTGNSTLLADNLPSQGGAEIAVDKAGNVYYVDTTSRATIQYLAAGSSSVTPGTTTNNTLPATLGSGFTQPTGVSIDAGGNVYVTDEVPISGSSSNRIVLIPNIGGIVSAPNQYTLSNQFSTGFSNINNTSNNEYGPSTGVGIDGYGNTYYAGAYPNSLSYAFFGRAALGTTALGSTSSAQVLNVSFTAAVTFGSFSVSGPFAQTTTCNPAAYAKDSVCTVSVTYTPTAAGPQSGTLTAYDNSSNVLGVTYLSGVGQASALNVDPGTVSAVGAGWTAPSAIAVDAEGNTYVADSVAGKIYKTAAGGTASTAVASGLSSPSAVAVDGAGNLYVGDSGNKQIVEVPYASSAYGTPIVIQTGLKGASGLTIDDVGDLYVADSGNARVLLLSHASSQQAQSLVSAVPGAFTSPVAVAVDNLGNLYVSDAGTNQVSQIVLSTSKQTKILSPTAAAGVAVDDGGSLYAADTGSGTVTRVPNVAGALNPSLQSTLVTVVAKPNAIALDASGNLYAADTVDAVVDELNRTTGLLSLGTVNVLSSSATISAQVSDGGTSALTFNTPYFTAAGPGSASYAVQNSSTCASGASVNPGATCTVAAIFTPQATGLQTETLTFASNAANSPSILVLSGSGAALTPTTLGLAVTAPTGTPAFGQSVTVTATVSPASGPTGTVTFFVDGIAQPPSVALAAGKASVTLNGLAGGAHTIAATYNGNPAYASSNSSLPLSISTAATVTSVVNLSAVPPLGSNPTSANLGASITMSATVTPSVSGTLTGTVTFLNGVTVLESGVAVTQTAGGPGQASFTTSTLGAGVYNITASYTGDSDYAASASATPASLQIVAPPAGATTAIFTSAGYVSSVNSAPGLTSKPDYQGSAGHLAANSRGDVFFDDAPYSFPDTAFLIEIPAAGGSQITLLTNLGYGASAVYADAGNNLWAADPNSNIIYIPFVNGGYASGLNASSLSACTMPVSTNNVPCKFYWQLNPSVGYYVQPSDLALDGSGNLYVVDKYDGATSGSHNRILEFAAASGNLTILVDNLPSSGGAQLAVDSAGDVYYADGNGVYYFTAASMPTTTGTAAASSVGTGLSDPTGVALDAGGNLYISDTGNSRILEIPYEKGARNTSNQYTLIDGANISSSHAQSGVGIDGYGNIYYVGNFGNSINYLAVGNLSLGSATIGTATGASTLALYFISPQTLSSIAPAGAPGTPVPFAIGTNACTGGKTYVAGASCTVSLTYTASAAGLQTGVIQALGPSGLVAQAELSGSGQAATLDVDPGAVAAIGSGWVSPSTIAVDAGGNTYVADGGSIFRTPAGAGTPSAVATGFSSPTALVIDGAGDLYVGDSGSGRILELTYANSSYGAPIVLQTGLKGASGLAIDALGNLYIADSGNARVLLLSRSGNLQAQSLVTTVGSGFTTPVAVAVDNARNLYVSDAGTNSVVQVAIPTSQQTTILSGLTAAAGVAVDAGGSLYAADSGKGTITRVPNINGVLNKNFETSLGAVVAKPVAIALDNTGNLYAADKADAKVAESNRTAGLLNFGKANVLASSTAVSANASNGGTAALAFNTPYETASGVGMASFSLQNSTTCAGGATLNPGAACSVAAIFTPAAAGVQSETLAFSSNAMDSASLTLTGIGTQLTTSTLAIAVTSPSGTPAYGQPVTVNATLTPAAGGVGTPTGTVTFYVDAVPQTPVPLTKNAASITLTGLTGGPHVLSASYSGDNNYASSASANLHIAIGTSATITSAVSITAPWVNPTSANPGQSVTLSATVALTVAGTPTGTVTFTSGSATLGSAQVLPAQVNGAAGGQATLTISTLAMGSYNIVATYGGDQNSTASTSLSAVPLLISNATITMAASSTDITGGGSPVTLAFGPVAGFGQNASEPGTVSLACSGLPEYATCSFSPAFVTFPTGSTTPQTVALTVVVNQPPPIAPSAAGLAAIPNLPGRPGLQALIGLCLFVPGVLLGLARKRAGRGRNSVWGTTLVLLLMLGACIAGTSGCGSTSGTVFTTPAGTSNFTVIATITPSTAAPNPPPAQTLQFTLTVN
ncbi:MAG: Ig-like domain repeat protein [Terracidiphilus sp.]